MKLKLLITTIFLLYISISFGGTKGIVRAQANPVDIFFSSENNLHLTDKAVKDGEQFSLKLNINGADNLLSINIKLLIPISELSIIQIIPSTDFCKNWDSPPNYQNGYLEFTCGQGNIKVSGGELLTLKLIENGKSPESLIKLVQLNYLNSQYDLISQSLISQIKITDLSLPETIGSVKGISTSTSNNIVIDNNTVIVFIDATLIGLLALILYLAYRYLSSPAFTEKLKTIELNHE